MGQLNVSYAQQPLCNEIRSTSVLGESTALSTSYKHSSKKSNLMEIDVSKKSSCSQFTSLKKPLTYSSEKLKQIGLNKSTEFGKIKFPFQISCFQNSPEKINPLIHRKQIFVTHPTSPGAGGACSLKAGLVEGRGGGPKCKTVVLSKPETDENTRGRDKDKIMKNCGGSLLGNENCLTGVNHDHTYAKNAAKIKKNRG